MKTRIYILSFIILLCSHTYAQQAVWTVNYYHAIQDTIFTISKCRLLNVTLDSLKIQTDNGELSISLYLLTDLSRPNSSGFNFGPILIGSAIGLATSFTCTQLNPKHPEQTASSGKTIEMFTLLGAGLGLIRSIDAETIKYHFPPATIGNQEKRKIIETILDEEKKIH